MNPRKLLARVSRGDVANVDFAEFCRLVEHPGIRRLRTGGSHQIFSHPSIPELVNLQDVRGQAKPYQVRQVIRLVERYNLKLEAEA